MTYRMIDLFSGAGGMSLGLTRCESSEPFRSVLAIDNDKAAAETYARNFGDHSVVCDIERWLLDAEVPEADVVIGGPPCQGFSLLNRKRQGDARRALWEPFLDVVRRSGARAFVMENVAELFRSPELQDIKHRADEMGFSTIEAVLNAADFGAPQTRKRTVVFGWSRSELPRGLSFPKKTHFADAEPGANNRWATVRDVIGDLPPEPIGTEIGEMPPLDLHFGRNPTELSRKRYRHVPPGGNRFDLQRNAPELTPNCWIRKTSGGTDLFGRLWWDRPSVTIRTEFFKPEKGRYLHPIEHRPITHREAARLMGFPDDFRFHGSKTEVARQIGNAVPPALAEAIGRALLRGLRKLECGETVEDGKKIAAE